MEKKRKKIAAKKAADKAKKGRFARNSTHRPSKPSVTVAAAPNQAERQQSLAQSKDDNGKKGPINLLRLASHEIPKEPQMVSDPMAPASVLQNQETFRDSMGAGSEF